MKLLNSVDSLNVTTERLSESLSSVDLTNLPALKWLNRSKRMNTLSISQIFQNLPLYQAQYLSILNDKDLYFSPVDNAHIKLTFLKDKQLYLGDLLQLWFSEKWIFNPENQISLTQFFSKQIYQPDLNLYLFAIDGNAVTGRNVCKAWDAVKQEIVEIKLDVVLPYYCYFESIVRPTQSVYGKTNLVA